MEESLEVFVLLGQNLKVHFEGPLHPVKVEVIEVLERDSKAAALATKDEVFVVLELVAAFPTYLR